VERLADGKAESGTREQLQKIVLNADAPDAARRHSLWVLASAGQLDEAFHTTLVQHEKSLYRSWAVRAAGNQGKVSDEIRELIVKAADDESPDVKLQVAIAARKIEGIDAMPLLVKVLASCGDDKLIPNIVWQNLHPMLEKDGDRFMNWLKSMTSRKRQTSPS
jgi:hypothetical protein